MLYAEPLSKLANLKLLQYCDRIENSDDSRRDCRLPPAASSVTVQVTDVIDGRHRMRHTKGQAHSGEALLFHAAHRSLCSMTAAFMTLILEIDVPASENSIAFWMSEIPGAVVESPQSRRRVAVDRLPQEIRTTAARNLARNHLQEILSRKI